MIVFPSVLPQPLKRREAFFVGHFPAIFYQISKVNMRVPSYFSARDLVEYHETPKTSLFGARVEKRIHQRNAVLHAVA